MGFANFIDNKLVDDDGLALVELPFAEQISSRFSAQVTWLASQIGDVPLGWHPIYRNAMRGLRATACEKRDGIEFSGPISVRGTLTVAVYYAITDRVASGILFKLSKRSECTCQDCGRAHGVRFRKYNQQTLCNKCHVRASLKEELRNWVGCRFAYNDHPVLEFDALPPNIKIQIPKNTIRTLNSESNGEKIDYVTIEELRKLTPRLAAIKRYLDDTHE